MRKTIPGLVLVFLAVSLVSAQVVDEYGQQRVRMVIKIDTYSDGTQNTTYQLLDPETGEALPHDPLTARVAEAGLVQLQTAVVTRSYHWNWPASIVFEFTEDALPHRAKFDKTGNKYTNKRRGTNNAPKVKSVAKPLVEVKPISAFPNPWDFYEQLDWDKRNAVVMTPDNQFFKDPNGILYDPEIVTSTKVFASGGIQSVGNRYVITFWIVETDIYFMSHFYSLKKIQYFRLNDLVGS